MNIILFEDHEKNNPLPKRDPRAVHLIKVLHKREGENFDTGILGGNLGKGKIEKIAPQGDVVFSLELNEKPPERIPIRIAVGFPRPIQLKRLLRDLANLGIEAIDLIGTELGEKSYRDTNLLIDGGARSAMIEGAVQARDTNLPSLSFYPSVKSWIGKNLWDKNTDELISADNISPQSSFSLLKTEKTSLVLAVGSERGWSDMERKQLETAGFKRLSLGKRALRTETACIAASILAIEKIGKME